MLDSRVLIAEDDPGTAAVLVTVLRGAGFFVTAVADGNAALRHALSSEHDLLVLDIGLPAKDGLTVLRQLRRAGIPTPVIVLTGGEAVTDTVAALEAGADDCMTKPFRLDELLARIRLRLREDVDRGRGAVLSGDGLSLDLRTRTVRVAGQLVDLTGRETTLLELLLRQRGQVVDPEQISHYVWARARDAGSNAVGLLVGTLRGKIGAGRIDTVGESGFRYT